MMVSLSATEKVRRDGEGGGACGRLAETSMMNSLVEEGPFQDERAFFVM